MQVVRDVDYDGELEISARIVMNSGQMREWPVSPPMPIEQQRFVILMLSAMPDFIKHFVVCRLDQNNRRHANEDARDEQMAGILEYGISCGSSCRIIPFYSSTCGSVHTENLALLR